ncbi:MAG: hypothetical protein ACKVP7_22005 [Hyphomicrobiaceae bacterium]
MKGATLEEAVRALRGVEAKIPSELFASPDWEQHCSDIVSSMVRTFREKSDRIREVERMDQVVVELVRLLRERVWPSEVEDVLWATILGILGGTCQSVSPPVMWTKVSYLEKPFPYAAAAHSKEERSTFVMKLDAYRFRNISDGENLNLLDLFA